MLKKSLNLSLKEVEEPLVKKGIRLAWSDVNFYVPTTKV
jgi:hypothetical protein